MKLWVDDIRGAPDSSWSAARTVTEAIRMIANLPSGEFDTISLDHDISHYENYNWDDVDQEVKACPECFCAVAYYLGIRYIDMPKVGRPKILVHSWNPTGAKEIKKILERYGFEDIIVKEYAPHE